MSTFSYKTLSTGLRVVTVPMKDTQTVTVMVLVEAGSKYENNENNGISHFLEHMCFKGTPTYPSSLVLSRLFDDIGAHHNAFTGSEYTGYYAKAHYAHFSIILDAIADMYLSPLLPPTEIEKEKGVIIEEINLTGDKPQKIVRDVIDALMYGDQPAGKTILGPKENILKFTREDFVKYRNEHYVADSTVVVVAGNIDEAQVIPLIEERFKDIVQAPHHKKEITKEAQTAPQVRAYYKETDQTHLVISFRSYNMYDDRRYATAILSTILGGTMSSRLWQKMREELGICYYVGSSNGHDTDVGTFDISAGVSNKRVGEALEGIFEEIRRIKETVSPEELQKAKECRVGSVALSLETSDALADFYGFPALHHKDLITPEEYTERINKVTLEEVQSVIRDIFRLENTNLALIGPHKDQDVFLKHISL